jgi:hypothetical protein
MGLDNFYHRALRISSFYPVSFYKICSLFTLEILILWKYLAGSEVYAGESGQSSFRLFTGHLIFVKIYI